MKIYLFTAAAIGFAASFAIHLLTFTNMSVLKMFPGVFALHVGLFAIVLIAAFTLKDFKDFNRDLSELPQKTTGLMLCLFAYAVFNFFSSFNLNEAGVPGTVDGKPVIESHGRVIRVLTEAESARHENYLVRGFSGHWMLFYFMLAATWCPKNLLRKKIVSQE